MCRFQHRQEQNEGKNFVVSLMQETHPSPTDRQRHGTAPGGQLVKQGEKKKGLKSNSGNLAWLSMHCSLKTP